MFHPFEITVITGFGQKRTGHIVGLFDVMKNTYGFRTVVFLVFGEKVVSQRRFQNLVPVFQARIKTVLPSLKLALNFTILFTVL